MKKECLCGCKTLINAIDKRGRSRSYVHGHAWRGRKITEEHRKNLRLSHLGKTTWNKGLKLPQFAGVNHPLFGKKRPEISGVNNNMWKGDDVGYNALHTWLYRYLGKANYCSNNISHISKRFEWANISGEYRRDLKDWMSLCTRCHHKYDNIIQRSWETRRAQSCAS